MLKNGTTEEYYYYIYNAQGDVIGILNSAGTQVVSYEYGAWGEILSTTGTLASTIGQKNPLRYRGYYYDSETGFYYLQSRYYDPVILRFVNADNVIAFVGHVQGNNVFIYCKNNPMRFFDPSGHCIEMWGNDVEGPCPGLGRCSDFDSFAIPLPKDVTNEIDNAMKKAVQQGELYCYISQNNNSSVSVMGTLSGIIDFYDKVNHKGPWDIKRKDSWEKTIGTKFPGKKREVFYRGMLMTPEHLGNYTYGYIGAAYGYDQMTLVIGSYYAAGFPYSGAELHNEINDWNYIVLGYNDYLRDNGFN